MSKKIVLAGGGTGGHLFPLLAVVEYIRKKYGSEAVDFLYLGPKSKLEEKLMTDNQIRRKKILVGKLRRYFSFSYLTDFLKLPLGVLQSLWYLFLEMPEAVFAKGGYASVPVVLVAWLYRIPIVIHESDAKPGLANKFLGSIATKVAISFERSKVYFPPHKTFLSGIPVDERVLHGDVREARKILNLAEDDQRPVIFILGGSQGARLINKRILEMLPALLQKYIVIHQTGELDFEKVVAEVKAMGLPVNQDGYYPRAFVGKEIKHFYALADVVISRAGATTIAEISANKKPSILVPITHSANNHQRINAFEMARMGAALVLEEDNFRQNLVLQKIEELILPGKIREKILANVGKFYNPRASEIIAKNLMELAS